MPAFALEFIALHFDIAHLHIHTTFMKSEGRDVSIAVNGHVTFIWWNKRVDHDTVEGAVDLFRNLAQNDKVCNFTFEAAREIGPREVNGDGPF